MLRLLNDSVKAHRIAVGALAGVLGVLVAVSLDTSSETATTVSDASDRARSATSTRPASCTQRDIEPPAPSAAIQDDRAFYPPDVDVAIEGFAQALANGYVIVRYRPDIPASVFRQLKRLAIQQSRYVIASPDAGLSHPIKVITARKSLDCTEPDVQAVKAFHDAWLKRIGANYSR